MPNWRDLKSAKNRAADSVVSSAVPTRREMPLTEHVVDSLMSSEEARTTTYGLHSLALGRALSEGETLGSARVPQGDRLILAADLTARAVARSDLISVRAMTARPSLPVERYLVSFQCKSIVDVDRQGNPKFDTHHQVEIYLHNQYPQRWPGMKWLTPIWHPNINHLNGSVCIDAAWWTASRSLDRLVVMLGEMLQWKNFHDDPTKPPFPWDPEAARWSREYRKKHPKAFPVDHRELLRPERIKIKPPREVPKHRPRVRLK